MSKHVVKGFTSRYVRGILLISHDHPNRGLMCGGINSLHVVSRSTQVVWSCGRLWEESGVEECVLPRVTARCQLVSEQCTR